LLQPPVASDPAVAPSASAITMVAASGARRRARAQDVDVVQPESRDGAATGAVVSSDRPSVGRTSSGCGIAGSALAATSGLGGGRGTTIGSTAGSAAGATAATGCGSACGSGGGVTAGASILAGAGAAASAVAGGEASLPGSPAVSSCA